MSASYKEPDLPFASDVSVPPDRYTRGIDTNTSLPANCRTFRVSEIPLYMDRSALSQFLDSLKVGKGSIEGNCRVFPLATCGSWQVATVSFHYVPDEFQKCKEGSPRSLQLVMQRGQYRNDRYNAHHEVHSRSGEQVSVSIDRDFYSMTPLYQPLGRTAKYDLIAVTGLSAHAFGSWKSPDQAYRMWLRDFLPSECPDIRVHIWGYFSSIMNVSSTTSITAISRQFLEDVKRIRENQTASRPLILIGHSLGGLVLQKALVDASKEHCDEDKAFYQSCIGVLFFGVPTRGLNATSIDRLVQGKGNEHFLQSISTGSDYLSDLESDFSACYKRMKNCTVVSFYEGEDTLSVEKNCDGKFERCGSLIRMVPRESAVCSLSKSHNQIQIRANHSMMVKFRSVSDENYLRVLAKIKNVAKDYTMRGVQDRLKDHQIWRTTSMPFTERQSSNIPRRVQERSQDNEVRRHLDNEVRRNTVSGIVKAQPNNRQLRSPGKRNESVDLMMSSILNWLSDVPYESHHQRITRRRLKGTGKWIFEKQEYLTWISSNSSRLFLLRGIPGTGKTYITSAVIDSLHPEAGRLARAYFYCDRAERRRREPEIIMNAIVQQLLQSNSNENTLPKSILDIYEERVKNRQLSSQLSLPESQALLLHITSVYPRTIICIDALDEVATEKRYELLKSLNHVVRKSINVVKLFATTRIDPKIVAQFQIFPLIVLEPEDNTDDIKVFVENRVKRAIDDRKLLKGEVSSRLKLQICEVITGLCQGMFQLAALQITILYHLYGESNATVKDGLQRLPDTLTEAYEGIYRCILSQSGSNTRRALDAFRQMRWSSEPLPTETLLHAITERVGTKQQSTRKATISAKYLLTICHHLLIVDKHLNVFRFAHPSVGEYLETMPELNGAIHHAEVCNCEDGSHDREEWSDDGEEWSDVSDDSTN
ncbi:hypothetical protein BZA77DRAFT_317793 [Pyronema omphalodes]|nr:hypothetical protein BZA77DRAFT_317793 [Pyronema omphalodes]